LPHVEALFARWTRELATLSATAGRL